MILPFTDKDRFPFPISTNHSFNLAEFDSFKDDTPNTFFIEKNIYNLF